MIQSARIRLADINAQGLSEAGRFSAAYGAAHSLAVAALRWHGFRPENRFIAFQCLRHTVDLEAGKVRFLGKCHDIRNQAEYEGVLDMTPQLLEELMVVAGELLRAVEALGRVE
jgi:predicted ATPase